MSKTKNKDMYDVTIESSHVFPKVDTVTKFNDPNQITVDLPEDFMTTMEVVRVPEVDMSIRGKLQGITSTDQMDNGGFCNYVYVVNDDVVMVTIDSMPLAPQTLDNGLRSFLEKLHLTNNNTDDAMYNQLARTGSNISYRWNDSNGTSSREPTWM